MSTKSIIGFSGNFFDRDLRWGYRSKKEAVSYCFFDYRSSQIRASQEPPPAGHESSLKKLSVIFNEALMQIQKNPEKVVQCNLTTTEIKKDPEPYLASQKRFQTFIRNLTHLDDKIKKHNEKIDASFLLWITHIVLNYLSLGQINWKIPRLNLAILEQIKTANAPRRRAALEFKVGRAFKSKCSQAKERRFHLASEKVKQAFLRLKREKASQQIQLKCLQLIDPIRYVSARAKIPIPTVTKAQMDHKYLLGKLIGEGGEGSVHFAMHRGSHQPRAIKFSISCRAAGNPYQEHVIPVIGDVVERELSPHVTRIYETFKIPRGTVLPGCKNWYPEALAMGYVMELLDGYLEAVEVSPKVHGFHSMPVNTKEAIVIQIASIEMLLWNIYGVEAVDGDGFMLRNVFYKNLTSSDMFRGQKLIDFDYWKYTICGQIFYVPRQTRLIKLGDYDTWTCDFAYGKKTERKPYQISQMRTEFVSQSTDIQALIKKYGIPPPKGAKVLDMFGA